VTLSHYLKKKTDPDSDDESDNRTQHQQENLVGEKFKDFLSNFKHSNKTIRANLIFLSHNDHLDPIWILLGRQCVSGNPTHTMMCEKNSKRALRCEWEPHSHNDV
jgi:hypothetical protein